MVTSTCKNCGVRITRRGSKVGVFCSLDCKGEWQRNQKPYNRDWLFEKYVTEKLSTYQIGKIVNRDPKQVYEWLKGYGIPTRERTWDVTRGKHPFHNEEWLRHEYIDKKRSTPEIAADYGVTSANVMYFLKMYHIKRRSPREIRKIKSWGSKGKANGMYGKRGALSSNWKGGITPERQAFYGSLEWKAAVDVVQKRDGGFCQNCGIEEKGHRIHIHHIIPIENKAHRADPNNLVTLCAKCHGWVHSKANIKQRFIKKGGQ